MLPRVVDHADLRDCGLDGVQAACIKGVETVGTVILKLTWADVCFWSPSTYTIDEAILSVYIYILIIITYSMCVLIEGEYKSAYWNSECYVCTCLERTWTQPLQLQWWSAFLIYYIHTNGCKLILWIPPFCLVNVWFVVVTGPYLSLGNASRSFSRKTPGVVKYHLNLIRENRCNWRTAPPSPPTQK